MGDEAEDKFAAYRKGVGNFRKAFGQDAPKTSGYDTSAKGSEIAKVASAESGVEPGVGLYDRFRESTKGLGKGIMGAGDAFKQWQDNHPAVKWALSPGNAVGTFAPGAALAVHAMNGVSSSILPGEKPKSANDVAFERSEQPEYSRVGPPSAVNGLPVSELPSVAKTMQASPLAGPQGDTSPFGSDKRLQGAQLDQLADHSGLQEKKSEEGEAHLQTLGVKAGQFQELAQAQAIAANAEKTAAEEAEKEQLTAEENWHKASDEASKMGVDPGRFYKNKDAGFWISMIVGSVASGMLSGLSSDGKNPFMDSVREMVRADIGAQETGIQQGWKKVKGLETAYERARVRGTDRITATIRQYDSTLQALQTDMQGRLLKATIPEQRANIEASLQALQLERDGMRVKMEEYWKQVKEHRAAAAASAANAAAERQWRHAKEMRELEIQKSRADAQNAKDYAETGKLVSESAGGGKLGERFVVTGVDQKNGVQTGVLAADPEARKQIEKALQNHEELMGSLDEIAKLRKERGALGRFNDKYNTVRSTDWERRMKVEVGNLRLKVKEGGNLGTLDKGSVEYLENITPDLDSVGDGGDTTIDQIRKMADRDKNAWVNSKAGPKAVRGYDSSTGRSYVREAGAGETAPTGAGLKSIPGARPL